MKARVVFRLFVLLLTLSVIPACQREKYTDKGIPEVETKGVTVLEEGATLYAEILSDGEKTITEHGFLWGDNENPGFDDESDQVLMGPFDGTGEYFTTISNSIKKDKIYYVRAFIKTSEITSFGNIVTFKGIGSKPPELISIMPQSAVCGDTVVIKGENFTYLQSDCSVLFGNVSAKILSSATNEVRVIVPVTQEGALKISVTVSGIRSRNTLDFVMKMPQLIDFSPLTGTFGDVVTLSGGNFSLDTSYIHVYFDNAIARIIECSRTYYKVEVPVNNNISPAVVKIKFFNYYTYGQMFTLRQAVITGVSPTVCRTSETVVITGENFNPLPEGNIVKIGGTEVQVISSSSSSISIKIPGILSAGNKTVSITTIAGTSVLWSGTIEVLPVWKRLPDFPSEGRMAASGFTVGGKLYFGTGLAPDLLPMKDFWEYDPAEVRWTQKSNFPVLITYASGLSVDGKGYFTLGKLGGTYYNTIVRYDPGSDTWEYMAPNPGSGSSMDSPGFVIDGKAYLPAAGEMYMYDPATNAWSRKAYPSELGYLGGAAAFSINGKGYLGICWVHEKTGNVSDFFEYNPVTNTWTKKTSFPGTLRNNATSFSLPNGKGYVAMGFATDEDRYLNDMWEYDPLKDTWSKLNDFPGSPRCGARAIVIGSDAYIIAGYGGAYEKDMYIFSPGD